MQAGQKTARNGTLVDHIMRIGEDLTSRNGRLSSKLQAFTTYISHRRKLKDRAGILVALSVDTSRVLDVRRSLLDKKTTDGRAPFKRAPRTQ